MPNRSTLRGQDWYQVLLSVGQAANSALELDDVLHETVGALEPFVPIDAIGVVGLVRGVFTPCAVHLPHLQRQRGETIPEFLSRAFGRRVTASDIDIPLDRSVLPHIQDSAAPHVHVDLAQEQRYAEDRILAGFGIRSNVRVPLLVRGKLIGAIDYCRMELKPFTPEEVSILGGVTPLIATALGNALAYTEILQLKEQLERENLALREEVEGSGMYEEIIGSSGALRGVISQIEKVAPTDSTVLITGETGVGKELIARAVHRRSPRSQHPMVKVSCASLPATLIASELFGHERGAFTGAGQRRIGRFELASSGSIFLDEVGELPPEIQVSLLRVIQEREFERVGGSQTIRSNARVIAATNRDLKTAADEGRFRSDLYYRLNVFPIEVPPLRERREDIPVLVEYFAARHGARLGKKFRDIDKRTMDRLIAYDWPGNVRECGNVIERAAILSDGPRLGVDERLLEGELPRRAPAEPRGSDLLGSETSPPREDGTPLRRQERELIERTLEACRGRISGPGGAAGRLGVPASTLESKIKKLGIDKFRYK
jgi:formate hydrogenlyase transcriptional activator